MTSAAYGKLEEGHRTTLVVGMIDMLECVARYIDPRWQEDFVRMLEYSGDFTSGDLRRAFDGYFQAEGARTAVASDFLSLC
jgi:hypothetical protein